jgi:2-enoate reductase
VLGGGLEGVETGIWLSKQGKEVAIIEALDQVIPTDIHAANRMMLLHMLQDSNINIITKASISEIIQDSVIVLNRNGKRSVISCDNVVLAVGLESKRKLYDNLLGTIPKTYLIGDSVTPRKIFDAIKEGYHLGCYI